MAELVEPDAITQECPACGESLPVTVRTARQLRDGTIFLEPDLTDIWAHLWAEHGIDSTE